VLRAYNNISLQHIFDGDVGKASKVLGDALQYAKKVGDVPYEISFNQTLAYTYLLLGELGRAKSVYDDLIRTLPKHYAVINETTLTDLGIIFLRLGDLQKSEESLERLEANLQGSSNFQAVIHCYLALANLRTASGDLISAESYFQKGYELFKSIGLNAFNSGMTPELLANLVDVELKLHKVKEARRYLDELKEIVVKLHGYLPLAYASKAEGLVFAEQGDWIKAVKSLAESVDIWRRLGWPYELADALCELARALDGLGDKARSRVVIGEALELYQRMGATLGVKRAQMRLADGAVDLA
jgi:tetratricopeptide (TPR) repeat protein